MPRSEVPLYFPHTLALSFLNPHFFIILHLPSRRAVLGLCRAARLQGRRLRLRSLVLESGQALRRLDEGVGGPRLEAQVISAFRRMMMIFFQIYFDRSSYE